MPSTPASLSFPIPYAAAERQSWRAIAAGLRNNALAGFPLRAFEEMAVARSFVGHQQIILNDPAAIHHVLIDNADNYRRTASISRMLGPVVGNGLFLAEGEDWRRQRRTVAPAFAPRMMGAVAGQVAGACDRLVEELTAEEGAEIDLFARLQLLALEIAHGCSCWRWRSPPHRCSRSTWRARVQGCAPICSAMPPGSAARCCSISCCRPAGRHRDPGRDGGSGGAGWRGLATFSRRDRHRRLPTRRAISLT